MRQRADSLLAAAQRPLPVRMRPDLIARRRQDQGRPYWVVKDPVTLQYYRFQPEEYALLRMLDGRISLMDLKGAFEKKFAPQTVTPQELYEFLGRLHTSGLVISVVSGQGTQLLKLRHRKRWRKFWSSLANPLAIRFRGIDPSWPLAWLDPLVRWFFSRWCVALCSLLMITAILLILVQFDRFLAKLPSAEAFFTAETLLWLWLALGATKIVHEFGHGLTCHHFGGQCHELGVILLVFTPCLYCNVSDSWMLPNRWQRIAIAAAGMYFELTLAAVATLFWWFSQPGLLQVLCLNVMLVSSVSTVMFNGNPLLRYDGYYILSDLLEIPNLQQKANQVLLQRAVGLCLGLKLAADPFLPKTHRWLFALYAVAAFLYRWFVLYVILWFLGGFLEPHGLKVVGLSLAVFSLVMLLVVPFWKLGKFFLVPGRIRQVKRWRFLATLGLLGACMGCFFFIRWTHYVTASVVVRPRQASWVYVQVPGQLCDRPFVKVGQKVVSGEPLAQLINPSLESEIAQLQGQVDRQKASLRVLDARAVHNLQAGRQVPHARSVLASLENQLRELQEDRQRLILRAPRAGVVLQAPWVDRLPSAEGSLPRWSGNPLDSQNRGCLFESGDVLCLIGEPRQLEAVVLVDQADVEFLRCGQQVQIQLEQFSLTWLSGRISEISDRQVQTIPPQLASGVGGPIPTQQDQAGKQQPSSPTYHARVSLQGSFALLRPGLRGRCRIHVGQRSWGAWLVRTFSETFHFRL